MDENDPGIRIACIIGKPTDWYANPVFGFSFYIF